MLYIYIAFSGLELQEKQNMVEDMSCLPCITLGQIDRTALREPVQHTVFGWSPFLFDSRYVQNYTV